MCMYVNVIIVEHGWLHNVMNDVKWILVNLFTYMASEVEAVYYTLIINCVNWLAITLVRK